MFKLHKRTLNLALVFFLSILWMELTYRIYAIDSFWNAGLLYTIVFSLPSALLCALAGSAWRTEKANRISGLIVFGFMTIWMLVQSVYATIFRTVMVAEALKMAGMVMNSYWKEALYGIFKTLPIIVIMILPLAAILFFEKKQSAKKEEERKSLFFDRTKPGLILLALALLLSVGIAEASTFIPSGGLMSVRDMYRRSFDPTVTVRQFGMLTTLRLDLTQTFFGLEEAPEVLAAQPAEPSLLEPVVQPSVSDPQPAPQPGGQNPEAPSEPEPEPLPVYEPNIMDIDFAALEANETDATLKKAHAYFGAREATLKNEYTGMFEGYNLIFITAEAFWKYAVDETHTPTLYKMVNEGFVFNNFYCPLGTHSTCDGEFATCTGLVPSNQYTAFYQTVGKNMYFCMGNQLKDIGYPVIAYHPHYGEYYRRDETHPNMGYNYYGIGTRGINIPMNWPESDLEAVQFFWQKHGDTELPFHFYMMTISGHLYYSWGGNYQCKKHKEDVADMNLSQEAAAYVACQMELDLALGYLVEELDKIGQLENTLFVVNSDHYPYGMEVSTWNELAGCEIDQTFGLAHSNLIIWSASMEEPVIVDKTCCSIDIIPTISNLMGLEYDSRLLMGRDILSDSPGIAVFYNKSFITDYGRYDVKANQFTPNEGVEVSDEYIKATYDYVNGLFTATDWILKNDYYEKIGLEHDCEPGKESFYR